MWKMLKRHCSLRSASSLEPDVEDDRVLGLGQIGDGEQVLGFEIGDDDRGALAQDLLGLGDHVAIGREDVLDELVILAEKGAALVVVGDGEAGALHAVVGQDRIDQRQRRRLVIGLAEIVDRDVDRRRRARNGRCRRVGRLLLLGNRAEAEQWKSEQQGGSGGAPSACQNAPRKARGSNPLMG